MVESTIKVSQQSARRRIGQKRSSTIHRSKGVRAQGSGTSEKPGGHDKLQAIADRGYFSGEQINACEDAGVAALQGGDLMKSSLQNA